MPRLIAHLALVFLIIGLVNAANAQTEKDVGTVLFKNGILPSSAGPGKVAFLRVDTNVPGQPLEMYLGDVNTKSETRALPGFNFSESPSMAFAWAPSGNEFVVPQKVQGCWEIFRFKVGSRTGEKVTNLLQFRESVPKEMKDALGLSEDQLLFVDGISYSPSGKRLIFLMNRPGKIALWWHDLATGKTRQATEDLVGYYGSFFPDDDQFCYTEGLTKKDGKSDEDILLRSISKGNLDTLCRTSDREFFGVISLDGKYMVYVKSDNNINNLYVMNLATKQSRQITSAPVGKHCTNPSWSPDGKRIFFQGSGFLPQPAVFVRDFLPF